MVSLRQFGGIGEISKFIYSGSQINNDNFGRS